MEAFQESQIYKMIIIVQISVISVEGIVLAIVTGTPLTRPVLYVYDSDPDAPGTTQAVSSHPGQVKISSFKVGHHCLFLIVEWKFCSVVSCTHSIKAQNPASHCKG
jgi:hypothetical protein